MNSISPTGTQSDTMSPLLSSSPVLSQQPITKAPPLPRTRPVPPNLTGPPTSHGPTERSLSVSRVQALRPSAQEWSAMSEGERGAWLKKAEKEARAAGQAFLEFGGDEERGVALRRAKSARK